MRGRRRLRARIVLPSLMVVVVAAIGITMATSATASHLDCDAQVFAPTYNSSTGYVSGHGEIDCGAGDNKDSLYVRTELKKDGIRVDDDTSSCSNTYRCASISRAVNSSGDQRWCTVITSATWVKNSIKNSVPNLPVSNCESAGF